MVGWIYVEALNHISYPIVQGKDNETYLHQTYEGNYNFAGTLFIDYENSSDFNDCNTLVLSLIHILYTFARHIDSDMNDAIV